MANDKIDKNYQEQFQWAVQTGNKLGRIGVMTDALLAAATGVSDLIADLYAALKVGATANDKYDPDVRIGVRYFEQSVRLLEKLGKIDDTKVAALTDWNSADADTSLRHLFAQFVNINGFDKTAEAQAFDAVFAYGTTA